MNAKDVNKIVRTVCNSEWQCPVFEAMDDKLACGCKGGADCPLRKALNLYRDESKKGGAR